jgi:hypothetical protein
MILHNSINFELVHKWYIVYDTSKRRKYSIEFPYHKKVEELECDEEESCFGNAQRNKVLYLCDEDAMVYFLDDDNIILPTFWDIIEKDIKNDENYEDTFYTFNQHRICENRISILETK